MKTAKAQLCGSYVAVYAEQEPNRGDLFCLNFPSKNTELAWRRWHATLDRKAAELGYIIANHLNGKHIVL